MGGEARGEIATYIVAKDAVALNPGNDSFDDLLGFCDIANSDICSYMTENKVLSMGITAAMLAFTLNPLLYTILETVKFLSL